MEYEKLSKRALYCMYAAGVVAGVVVLLVIGVVNLLWFFPKDLFLGKVISLVLVILTLAAVLVSP